MGKLGVIANGMWKMTTIKDIGDIAINDSTSRNITGGSRVIEFQVPGIYFVFSMGEPYRVYSRGGSDTLPLNSRQLYIPLNTRRYRVWGCD